MNHLDEMDRRLKQIAEKLVEFDNRLVESEKHRAEFNKHRLEFDRYRAEFDKHRKEANARLAELDQHRAVEAASRVPSPPYTAKKRKNTRKKAAEYRKKAEEYHKESAEYRREFDKYCPKREKFLHKLDRRLDNIAKMVGAMGNNTGGRIAEEFFYRALRRAPRIDILEFDDIRANVTAGPPRKECRVRHIDDEWRVCRHCRGQTQSARERYGKDARSFGAELSLFVP